MTYMENIFICMASPLLIAALCMGKRHTGAFLFCLAGMGMCLLSAYLNTFLAALYGADAFAATVEIAPVVEEGMKLLPLLFYLLVFEPQARQIGIAAVITALSFATFENICYLIQTEPRISPLFSSVASEREQCMSFAEPSSAAGLRMYGGGRG